MTSRLHQLSAFGQSVWIDFLSRDLIDAARLDSQLAKAQHLFNELYRAGVDYDDVVAPLEREGIEKFVASFNELLKGISERQHRLAPPRRD